MRAAVFAHGRGMLAYTAGRLCSFTPEYDITFGSGNGALLAAFAASGEYDMLHDFIVRTKDEKFYDKSALYPTGEVSIWTLLLSYIRKRSTKRSVMSALAPYLEREISPFYYKYMTENKSVYISIYNATKHALELKMVPDDIPHERFSKFLLASISHPLIFSNIKIGKNEYRSAATIEPLPLSKIVDMGISKIDIYTNLPNGCLDAEPQELMPYSNQLLDENSRYLQLKELRNFLGRIADNRVLKYRIFFMPIGINDSDGIMVNKYFDKGYTASDISCTFEG